MSPNKPDAIRIADHDLADEVRAEVAGTIPVTVAPTPELNELFQILIASMPAPSEDEPSYFAHGRISPNAVDMLFTASGFLFAITPWSLADDNQILRMNIPALGIDGACLSVIGQLGQSRGVLIFPSRDDFERFLEAAANSDPPNTRPRRLRRRGPLAHLPQRHPVATGDAPRGDAQRLARRQPRRLPRRCSA